MKVLAALGVIALAAGGFEAASLLRAQVQRPDLVNEIVTAHRRLTVLGDAEQAAPPPERSRIVAVARAIYARKQERLQQLEDELTALLQSSPDAARARALELADRIAGSPALEAGDRLAFIDLLYSIHDGARARQLDDVAERMRRVLVQVEATRDAYDREIRPDERARGATRQQWQAYVRRLRSIADPATILRQEHSHESEALRGSHPAEVTGTDLPPATVILTFDDGPHSRYTPEVVAILAKVRTHAVFFQVGKRLGAIGEKSDSASLLPLAALTRQLTAAGHLVANHSYSHRAMATMQAGQQAREVAATNTLLAAINGNAPRFFRPPYGARNAALLDRVAAMRMRSVMWNIDSMDWADPVPASIVRRVVAQTKQQRRGIVLFHDIHSQTVVALPQVLEAWRAAGVRIAPPSELESAR